MPGKSSSPSFEQPSAAYVAALEDCTRFHAQDPRFAGDLVMRYSKTIAKLARATGAKTVLDYGCGKGIQYEQLIKGRTIEQFWGVKVTKYDPAWPPHAGEPTGRFDMVICTHVLGSIPPQDMEWVVDRLYGFARHALFVGEIIGPVEKKSVFRDPASVSIGLTVDDWTKVLARKHKIKVLLGTHDKATDVVSCREIPSL